MSQFSPMFGYNAASAAISSMTPQARRRRIEQRQREAAEQRGTAGGITREQLRQGFPMPAQREEAVRTMGPPTPAAAMGPMPEGVNRTRLTPLPGPAMPGETSPQPARPAARPTRPATTGMMGPPTEEGSRVQAGAQDFRMRRAQRDEALIAQGIDPVAAREQQFLNRPPSTRELVLRAATLRARGNSEAADRLIEESRMTRDMERGAAVERMALRNPERAGSAPAIDRIARRQAMERAEQATQDVEFGAFQQGRQSAARGFADTAETGAIEAGTGRRIAETTAEGRVALAGEDIGAQRSRAQLEQATNESRMRIMEATTEMTAEQIARDLDILRQTAPTEVQAQITAAQARLESAQTQLEREIALRQIQTIVGQVQMETAGPAARAQAQAGIAASEADTAVAGARAAEATQRQAEVRELGPAEIEARRREMERGATVAPEDQVADQIRQIELDRMQRYLRLGINPQDATEVQTADAMLGGQVQMEIEKAVREVQGRNSLITNSTVASIQAISDDIADLRRSGMDPKAKAGLAREMLKQIPKELPARRQKIGAAAAASLGQPTIAVGAATSAVVDSRRYRRMNNAYRTMIRDLEAMAKE